MKSAQEWVDVFWEEFGSISVKQVRVIQADALRWAANLSGPLHRKAALEKADELDPPEKK